MVDSLVTVPHSAKGRGLIDWFLNKKITQWICNTGVGSTLAMMWTATTVVSTLCWELGLIDFSKSLFTHDECWICTPGVGSAWCAENWIDWFLQKFGYTWWMLDLYPRCWFCVMCWELDWLISPKVWLHMMNVGSLPQVWALRDVLRTWIDRFLHKICLNMINVDMCYRCGFCVSHEVDSHYCPHYA